MISRVRTVSLLAVFLFLSSAMMLSAQTASLSGVYARESTSLPASTSGLGTRNTPISILVYGQFSDLDSEYLHTIDAISSVYGPQFEYDEFFDYTDLASLLPGHDILLLPELESVSLVNISDIASLWSGTLSNYVQNGGNIILLDHRNDDIDAPGAHLYNETGLLSFTGVGDYNPIGSLTTAYVANASNALAYGLPASFGSSNGMISIQTTDGITVVDDGTDAIVVQKIIGTGNVVYLGFDYYAATTEIDTIFGNALRLTRHIVFDDSHGQIYHLDNQLSSFGDDLHTNRYAVSSIDTFDYDYLAACDVIFTIRTTVDYTSGELSFIEDFVEAGGSLMVSTNFGSFGDHLDDLLAQFGYIREPDHSIYDSDDYVGGNQAWVPFTGSNLHNHSATVGVSSVEIYGGAGFTTMPANAFTLIATDDDGTASFGGGADANETAISAVSIHGMGRVGVFGDTNAWSDVEDTDSDATINYVENAAFFINLMRWLSAGGIEEKKVLFDASHSWNFFLTASYLGFGELLTENGYTLFWMEDFYPSFISEMDVLVIEDGYDNYTASEIDSIEAYVNGGGGLLLLGGEGQYGEQADMVGNRFGFDLNNTGSLIDSDDSLGPATYVFYNESNFGNHPIMQGVDRIESDNGAGFVSIDGATPLVITDTDGTANWTDGTPASGVALMAAKSQNMGRIVFCGDYKFLRHNSDLDIDGVNNLYDSDNSVFILNTLYWLSENRAPIVEIITPNGGETLNGTVTISWTAVDYDSDPMDLTLYYSEDGGSNWVSLATGLSTTSYDWNTTLVDDGNQYLVRLVASDGLHTSSDQSDAVFTIDNIPDTTPGGGIPLDPTLLLIIGAAAVVVIIILVVVMKKKK